MYAQMVENIRLHYASYPSFEGGPTPAQYRAYENVTCMLAELILPPLQSRIAFVTSTPVYTHNGELGWVRCVRSQAILRTNPVDIAYPELADAAAVMTAELQAMLERYPASTRLVPMHFAATTGFVIHPITYDPIVTFFHRFGLVES